MQLGINAIQATINYQQPAKTNTCSYIIKGWPEHNDQIQQDIRPYWTFKDDMTVINGVIMKGRHIVVSEVL